MGKIASVCPFFFTQKHLIMAKRLSVVPPSVGSKYLFLHYIKNIFYLVISFKSFQEAKIP